MTKERSFRILACLALLGSLLVSNSLPAGADALDPSVSPVVSVEGGVSFLGGRLLGPPQMSDDGGFLVYREGESSSVVRWLDRASGTNRSIVEDVAAGGPEISGDGQWVVFVDYGAGAVQLWNAAAGELETLSEPGATFDVITPTVSTDGARVLWNETRNGDDAVRLWNRSDGSVASYPGTNGFLSGDGSRFVYVPEGESRPALFEVSSGASREVGFASDLSDDGLTVAAGTAPRGVEFTNLSTGVTASVSLIEDSQLNIPLAYVSGDGAYGFFNTNVAVVQEDTDTAFNPYRIDLETEEISVVNTASEGTVIDVSSDGLLALFWTNSDAGFELSMLDFTPPPPSVAVAAQQQPQLTDQVGRLYEAFFLRPADAGGQAFWNAERADGRSLVSIAEQFAQSPEFVDRYGSLTDEEFVDLIYQNVQGRPGEEGGRSFWIAQLALGVSRGEVMVGFSESAEFVDNTGTSSPTDPVAASVWRLYRAYYLRDADQGGFDFWYQEVLGARSLASVSDAFSQAPEFDDLYGELSDDEFVEQIYQNVLQRSPDAAGLAFWRAQMAAGSSRGQVMLSFSDSPEFIIATDTLPPS